MATKTKKTFKQSMKETGQKVKDYGRTYKGNIRSSYDLGFAKGWDDAHYVPNRLGCRSAAAIGYRKGIKSRYKSDKFQRQYQRWGNK